ncbi:hypothetical protein RhiirA4_463177 [Rhizophagus irregularis]|uniref:SWIM-type domain-containing protein n=1 Tax=Rhizophagus irregularis TaxID=588596 RepID=A0A2I1GME5_9GLOM|nr:hypothetical protein RhiirA4_463177 [Rhizophagus irregularis]
MHFILNFLRKLHAIAEERPLEIMEVPLHITNNTEFSSKYKSKSYISPSDISVEAFFCFDELLLGCDCHRSLYWYPKSNNKNEYFVVSTRDDNLTYTVNIEIGTCSCPVRINGAPCKHQGAVSAKFHITTLNFLLSLTSEDRMLYAYIALDGSFYASLRAEFA